MIKMEKHRCSHKAIQVPWRGCSTLRTEGRVSSGNKEDITAQQEIDY